MPHLQDRFPDQHEACRAAIENATAQVQDHLALLGRLTGAAGEQAAADVETGDGESLIDRRPDRPDNALSTTQEQMLQALAAGIRQNWTPFRTQLRTALADDLQARHQRLMALSFERRRGFSEIAWAWIDSEEDLALLDLLLCLTVVDNDSLLFCNLRRALFEHRDLCDRVHQMLR